MTGKKKLYVAGGLVMAAAVAITILGLVYVQPASAMPGYSCNPSPGHGGGGCHVSPPSPPTTAPPATGAPAGSGSAPASAGSRSTSAGAGSTTAPSSDPGDTTITTDPGAALASVGDGGGSGPGGGFIAVLVGLGVLALAGWMGVVLKGKESRGTSAGEGAPESGPVRFVLAERVAHWAYALCFLAAGLTGALMWIPSTRQWLAGVRYPLSQYHAYVGLAMVIVPLLILLVLDRRRLAENRRALDQWDSNDRRWLRFAMSGGTLRGKKTPPQGRFNAGQKINSHLVVGLATGFVVTGILLLVRSHLPFWLTSAVLFAHEVLAITGGVLLLGHLGMALFTRHGRAGLRAMAKGTLPSDVAREGHATWYAEWLAEHRGKQERPPAVNA